MTGAIQLVIFDCDGVLVDSEVISNSVLARLLTEEGVPLTLAETRRDYQGLLLDEILELTADRFGRRLPVDFLERFEAERADEFRRELKPVAGAADAVRHVQAAGIPLCVASQGKLEKTRMTLGLTGLDRLIPSDAVFSSYSVRRGKPYPDLFLYAAGEMGADPEACVVIEDTASGVMAAVAAGMRVLGFAADSDEAALREAGAEVFESLDLLPSLLGLSVG